MPAQSKRLVIWALLAAPAGWWIYRYATEMVSYGEVIHFTGDFSIQLLIVTLAVTPLRLLAQNAFSTFLVRHRRALGVASFCYAALHLIVYVYRKADMARIVSEGVEPGLLTGWIALFMMTLLAITSNDFSVRLLRAGWKKLHLLAYPVAVLALAHWVLTAFDPLVAYIHAGVLAALEALRLVLQARRRRPSSA